MKTKLSTLLDKLFPIIVNQIQHISDFRHYLDRGLPELRPHLPPIQSFEEATKLVTLRTTVIHVEGYRSIVDRFEMEDGKPLVDEYETEIDRFCSQTTLDLVLGIKFLPLVVLKCETIKIAMEWENFHERTLEDVRKLRETIFGSLYIRVTIRQIYWDEEEETIVILLHFPRYLTDSMLVTAQRNFKDVKDLGLAQLLVGHYPIFDRVPDDEVHLYCVWCVVSVSFYRN